MKHFLTTKTIRHKGAPNQFFVIFHYLFKTVNVMLDDIKIETLIHPFIEIGWTAIGLLSTYTVGTIVQQVDRTSYFTKTEKKVGLICAASLRA